MNTTYQSDYTPYDWLQNNFVPDRNEFCSSENVDECLKYISQELCALGYPSIYSSDCISSWNCDIVKFLNVTFELLKKNNEHIQAKEELENSNQCLSIDLNLFKKKNSQLKNVLEQSERKLASTLEKERQIKEKNEQLSQLLKTEKEETKKLSTQFRQQKVIFQHEIRKYENNLNHIKAKINQLLSDKSANKKIASISTSHALPRNTGQRGKWKTGSAVTSAIEDMYSSVISSYETRCRDMSKELKMFQKCLHSILLQISEIVSASQDVLGGNNFIAFKDFVINDVTSAGQNVQAFEDKFKYLLHVWKESAMKNTNENYRNLEDELVLLQSKVSEYETVLEKNKKLPLVNESQLYMNNSSPVVNKEEVAKSFHDELIKNERMQLEREKVALSKALENIEKEKANISAQKVAILRMAMQQKISPSAWHESLTILPSISVITSRNGETKILTSNQVNFSSSSSNLIDQTNNVSASEWETRIGVVDNGFFPKYDSMLSTQSGSATESPVFSSLTADNNFLNADLPSWAKNKSDTESLVINDIQNSTSGASQNISTDEIEVPNDPSSEEINLLRLTAAVQDIENRKSNTS